MQTVSNYSQKTWYQVNYNCIIKALKEIKRTCTNAKIYSFTCCISIQHNSHTAKIMERRKIENREDEKRNRETIHNGIF